MKIAGLLLLIAGWVMVLVALALLRHGGARNMFVAAGIGIQMWGLVALARAHLPARMERGRGQ